MRRRRRFVAAIAGCVLAGTALATVRTLAATSDPPLNGPAVATQRAVPVGAEGDLISLSQTSYVTSALATRVNAAATSVGAAVAEGRGASLGMLGVWRGATPVQQPPAGFQIPMSTTILPVAVVGELMGRPVADVLGSGSVVMGATSAGLRGAQAGDAIALVAADGSTRRFTIGLVADDASVGGTEILMAPAQADSLGVTTVTRLIVHGFSDRRAIDGALTNQGVVEAASIDGQRTRVSRSWDPPSPDATIGMARTKELLGEFAYRDTGDSYLDLSEDWVSSHLPAERRWLYAYDGAPASAATTIRARCNLGIEDDLIAALAEVHDAGLDSAIDFANANTYGGCFAPRFNRVTGSVGFVSRHAWGMAFDTNTTTNPQGGVPRMNCEVVRIFRRHNFAWGGNFTSRDGMHFEWVGERRDQIAYPSTYCPNTAGAYEFDAATATVTQRATIFADDGLAH